MSEILIRLFNKKSRFGNTRSGYSVLSGITGIICNILLSLSKLIVGTLSGSVSITADAVNNLADGASNTVTIIGARLSSKEGDKEHPFGHGRIEYISALIVTFTVFIMAFELAKSSVLKIINPEPLTFSPWYVAVLTVAILVKIWMAYFNNKLYKITDNINLKAVRQDCIGDCFSTLSTMIALAAYALFKTALVDGIIGICVAVFIFFSAVDILKGIISPLLGEPPSKEVTDEIERIITESPLVTGVHDLIVHSYGAEKVIASAHAEVPAEANIVEVHDVIDKAEREIAEKLGIIMCIHADPVFKDDIETENYRKKTEEILKKYGEGFTFHDFRVTGNESGKRLEFDVTAPFETKKDNDEIRRDLALLFGSELPETAVDITVEHPYV